MYRQYETYTHAVCAPAGAEPLVLRLMASFILFSTSRVICKGQLTMEKMIFSLKHYWRFVDLEPLELHALS